jgi:hypothetical protein
MYSLVIRQMRKHTADWTNHFRPKWFKDGWFCQFPPNLISFPSSPLFRWHSFRGTDTKVKPDLSPLDFPSYWSSSNRHEGLLEEIHNCTAASSYWSWDLLLLSGQWKLGALLYCDKSNEMVSTYKKECQYAWTTPANQLLKEQEKTKTESLFLSLLHKGKFPEPPSSTLTAIPHLQDSPGPNKKRNENFILAKL